MKNLSKVVTAVLAAAMVFGSAMSVSANTLESATPGGRVESVVVTQKFDDSGSWYSIVTHGSEPWDNGFTSSYEYTEGGYTYTLVNKGSKDYEAYLARFTPVHLSRTDL